MRHRKLANAAHEEGARLTSADFCGGSLRRGLRREKRIRNRVAKREDRKRALAEGLNGV